jgi:hypothetical protein
VHYRRSSTTVLASQLVPGRYMDRSISSPRYFMLVDRATRSSFIANHGCVSDLSSYSVIGQKGNRPCLCHSRQMLLQIITDLGLRYLTLFGALTQVLDRDYVLARLVLTQQECESHPRLVRAPQLTLEITATAVA